MPEGWEEGRIEARAARVTFVGSGSFPLAPPATPLHVCPPRALVPHRHPLLSLERLVDLVTCSETSVVQRSTGHPGWSEVDKGRKLRDIRLQGRGEIAGRDVDGLCGQLGKGRTLTWVKKWVVLSRRDGPTF